MIHLKTIATCVFCLSIVCVLTSCSDNSVTPGENEPDDEVSGVYFLEGYKINLEICYVSQFCEAGEILSRDTVQTSFAVELELVDNRTDTLLFSGLEGADIGVNHPEYNGYAADENCSAGSPPEYCAYASFQDDSLTFDIASQPGHYYGGGTLENNELSLQTSFRHRGAGVDYVLSGMKQEN